MVFSFAVMMRGCFAHDLFSFPFSIVVICGARCVDLVVGVLHGAMWFPS